MLTPSLTVEEHLWLYGRLKGRTGAEVAKEMDKLLQDVGLECKRHEPAKNLSGTSDTQNTHWVLTP